MGKDLPVTATGPLPSRPLRHIIVNWWSRSCGAVSWWSQGDEFPFVCCPFPEGPQQGSPQGSTSVYGDKERVQRVVGSGTEGNLGLW